MSNIYDKSSLVLIPSGTKTGKVFSQKPVSGDGDFTFTRASAATRVNADGNIEKETQNLLVQSNNFNTNWGAANSSVTGGQSGYDGSSDAWLLDSSSEGYIFQYVASGNVGTLSIYAKANSVNNLRLRTFGPSINAEGFFDLANGVVGSSTNLVDLSIESVGGGWYRCSVVYDNAPSLIRIYPSVSSSTSSGTIGSIYIQDAQLEQGLVARDYIETTTSAVEGGITDNTPRLDYTDSSCPALLLEPLRTNLINHSEYIAAGVTWSAASGMTSENNSVVSPEGVQNATKLIRPNSTGAAWVKEGNISATIGLNQVVSVFAKSGSNNILNITYYDQTANDLFFNYDLSNGTIYSAPTSSAYYVDAGIEDYGNGWYRCYAIAEAGRVDPQFQLSVGVNRGGAANSYLYVYGASHEKDVNYPTSYIPTYGSSVSRVEETTYVTSATDIIGQTEGTMFVEYDQNLIGQSATRRIMALSNGTTSNRIVVYVSSSNKIDFYVRTSSGQLFLGTSANFNTKGMHKIAAAYKNGDYVVYLDGTQIISGAGTAGTIPACNRIDLGNQMGANDLFEPVHQAMLFKTRLSNEELAALTTI
jgi:hypothetical protein